ncbi:MAG: four-carbon acid sugar kinase family protein [Bryobacteraceae bacterium]
MVQALVLADDATGALELGALLAAAGISTVVGFAPERSVYGVDAVVFDTETRHLPPPEARSRVAAIARRWPVPHIFKKTDSTLRGNIGVEFDALLEAHPQRQLHYAPAYPRLGRTVVNGVLLLNGRPVAESKFAVDPFNPVTESHIPTLLANSTARPVTVYDGEREEDLQAVAVKGKGDLCAGPGGLARYWIDALPIQRGVAPALPRVNSLLVVCGSLHPVSQRQARQAREMPNVRVLIEHRSEPAIAALREERFDALAIFGGDTAYVILSALGCSEVNPIGEALPGVPVSTIFLDGRRITLITKAGGFGEDGVVAEILDALRGPK